jgi:DNA-directed RNA polymerase I subunit RPA1
MLWKKESQLLKLIYGNLIVNKATLANSANGYEILSNDYKMFFIDVIPVTPNRFRPENKLGDQTFLHGHTVVLSKIL